MLTALELAKECGVWLEVTNLVIPTLNDSPEMIRDLATWMVRNLGAETPLHFSAFSPRYRMTNLPRTPASVLERAREIARDAGLEHVYVGNVMGTEASNTYCPRDGTLLIERVGYRIRSNVVGESGHCPTCRQPVPGVWR